MGEHENFMNKLLEIVERITTYGDMKSVDSLLAMTANLNQPLFASLAESFARMVVKLEAREFQLECTIENLQRIKAELELANYDPLTRLPNRVIARDRLQQGLLRAKESRGMLALLYLDLDRFKWVNDNLGHPAGDELLQQVSQRLRNCVRETDVVARIGGDEFLCILTEISSDAQAREAADRFVGNLRDPFSLEAGVASIGVSVGVAIYPEHGATEDSLIACADRALYLAKEAGRNGYRVFDQRCG